jgi:hypothetical protein
MMRALWWFLVVGLSSCRAEPDHITSQGVRVWDDYGLLDVTEVDTAIDWVLRDLPFGADGMRVWLKDSRLRIAPRPYDIGSGLLMGHFDWHAHHWGFVVIDHHCPVGHSALAHEMLHGALMAEHGDADAGHSSGVWDSAISRTLDRASQRICR